MVKFLLKYIFDLQLSDKAGYYLEGSFGTLEEFKSKALQNYETNSDSDDTDNDSENEELEANPVKPKQDPLNIGEKMKEDISVVEIMEKKELHTGIESSFFKNIASYQIGAFKRKINYIEVLDKGKNIEGHNQSGKVKKTPEIPGQTKLTSFFKK